MGSGRVVNPQLQTIKDVFTLPISAALRYITEEIKSGIDTPLDLLPTILTNYPM
ncbi:MAG TPA: hypothetical protein VMV49_11250 [Candidatus Deferrimicrobium sp.]|nr:hypothetical protein [Candidatus Deferrimicrobium sp.]